MADIIQQRRDTAARWAQYNPILMEGEVGYVTDNPNQYKIGNGRDRWNNLPLRGYTGTITQDTGDDENAVMSQKATTAKLTELGSKVRIASVFHVNEAQNKPSAVYTFEEAVALVPEDARKYIRILIYNTTSGNVVAIFNSVGYISEWTNKSSWIFYRKEEFLSSIYNVNINNGITGTTTIYTLEEAITKVPESERCLTKVIVYRTSKGAEMAIFKDSAYKSGFTDKNNWITVITSDNSLMKEFEDVKTMLKRHLLIDVNSLASDTSAVYTLTEAIKAVPSEYRGIAKGVLFKKNTRTTVFALYNGTTVSGWENVNHWTCINDIAEGVKLLAKQQPLLTARTSNIFNWRDYEQYYPMMPANGVWNENFKVATYCLGSVSVGDYVVFKDFYNGTYEDKGVEYLTLSISSEEIPVIGNSYSVIGQGNNANKRGYVESPIDGYVFISVRCNDIISIKQAFLDKLKTIVVKKTTSIDYPSVYEDYYKPYIEESDIEEGVLDTINKKIENKLNKNFGVSNSGKTLIVGSDGNVVTSSVTPEGGLIGDVLERQNNHVIYLGANLISNGTGNGWANNNEVYQHTSGYSDELVFNYETIAGRRYVAQIEVGSYKEETCFVAIGNYPWVDVYNGVAINQIGFVSLGGKFRVKVKESYLSTVKVSLHDVVEEVSAVSSIVFNGYNAFMDSKMNDITSYWNIGIGDIETFAASENSTRNIGIGKSALNKLKTGTRNIGIGTYALNRLVSGDRNVGIGSDAFWFVERGEENVAVGYNALGPMNLSLEANRNVAIGSKAGSGMTVKAEDNIFIGNGCAPGSPSECVKNVSVGSESGSGGQNCVSIGYYAGRGNYLSNVICIGSNSKAEKNNQTVIGNNQTVETKVYGDLVIQATDGTKRKVVFNSDGTCTWESI